VDSAAASQAVAGFEAMLLVPVLRPIFAGCDLLGDYGVDVFAAQLARELGARQ
jgi:hypothetical protein